MKIVTAKYKGKCYACLGLIKAGDTIWWTKTAGHKHADCGAAMKRNAEDELERVEGTTHLGDFTEVYRMFGSAFKVTNWPRITIDAEGFKFYLRLSELEFQITVNTDDCGYGSISKIGEWYSGYDEVDERMADALSRLAMDPVGTVAMYGRSSGKCCFCNNKLLGKSAVSVGYDSVCAKRWAVKWGVWGMTADDWDMPEMLAAIKNHSPAVEPAILGNAYCTTCDDTEKIDGLPCPGYHAGEKAVFDMLAGEGVSDIALAAQLHKETVTLNTKVITFEVDLPECYS